jgi:hypothetical protein
VVNLVKFDKGAYITSINVFNHLPQLIKILVNNEKKLQNHTEEGSISTFILLYERNITKVQVTKKYKIVNL